MEPLLRMLRDHGVDNAGFQLRVLQKHLIDPDRVSDAVSRLITGEPLSRILGFAEFYGLDFMLSPDTLDPRQDTELLIDLALKALGDGPARVLDIGTGSGCIAISVLVHAGGDVRAVATDLSAGAIETARRNAEKHQVDARIEFVQTSWADGVQGGFDLILSNPPYIRSDVVSMLDMNVRDYDPLLALDGGAGGLDAYRAIIAALPGLLNPGGVAVLEIGYDQGESVRQMLEQIAGQRGTARVVVHPDLNGRDRAVEISYGDK